MAKAGLMTGRSAASSRASSANSAWRGSTASPASVASIASSVAKISGSSGNWSGVIAGLSQLFHGPVEQGSGVRFADAQYLGHLDVGHPGMELEGNDLPLPCRQLG